MTSGPLDIDFNFCLLFIFDIPVMRPFLDGNVAFQLMENLHKHLHSRRKMPQDFQSVSDLGSDRALQQFPEQ